VENRLATWFPDAHGITVVCSLAKGADTLVAETLMGRGASLHVIVPSRGYAGTFQGIAQRKYQDLLEQADSSEVLDFEQPTEVAYMTAGATVVRSSDILIAVWDGKSARGLGGTADVVTLARRLGKQVRVVWPPGVSR
jgi:hypothetical protein